jgi:hypothetical protein
MKIEIPAGLLEAFESEDDLGVVIRAHITIERQLNELVSQLVKNCEYIRKMKLDYSNTVKLAIALGLDPRFEKSLNSLGSIRNGFAHNNRPELGKSDVNNLYSALDEKEKINLNESIKESNTQPEIFGKTHKEMTARQQFINIAIFLSSAIYTASNQVSNKV